MALGIELKTSRGLKSNYHRILTATENYETEKTIVRIGHYASKDYRDSEKKSKKSLEELAKLNKELEGLVLAPTKDNLKRRVELSEKINTITEKGIDTQEKLLWFEDIELEGLDKGTRDMLYNRIMELPEYKKATLV